VYKIIGGYGSKEEYIREKKINNGDFKESQKIISNLSVFLAVILRWLV